jgi:hypothetical protein
MSPPFTRSIGSTSTRSPTRQPSTPAPISATSPATSSPMMAGIGIVMPGMPRSVNTS